MKIETRLLTLTLTTFLLPAAHALACVSSEGDTEQNRAMAQALCLSADAGFASIATVNIWEKGLDPGDAVILGSEWVKLNEGFITVELALRPASIRAWKATPKNPRLLMTMLIETLEKTHPDLKARVLVLPLIMGSPSPEIVAFRDEAGKVVFQ